MRCLLSSQKITLYLPNNSEVFKLQVRLNKRGMVKVFDKDLKKFFLQRVLLEI